MEAKDFVNKRTGFGTFAGALMGFVLGGGPGGAIVGALAGAGLANLKPKQQRGEMTPQRKQLYDAAMNSASTPAELRELADTFEGEGLKAHAEMLRKRAELRELPKDVAEKRRMIYRQMMSSDSPEEIDEMAASFADSGAMGVATGLRAHAGAVRAAHDAGASGKPMPDTKAIDAFADKLAKAIFHFQPGSREAGMAAANLLRARGMKPTPELIKQTIMMCVAELKVPVNSDATASSEEPVDPAAAANINGDDVAEAPGEEPVARGPGVEPPLTPPATVAGEATAGEPTTMPPPPPESGSQPVAQAEEG